MRHAIHLSDRVRELLMNQLYLNTVRPVDHVREHPIEPTTLAQHVHEAAHIVKSIVALFDQMKQQVDVVAAISLRQSRAIFLHNPIQPTMEGEETHNCTLLQ